MAGRGARFATEGWKQPKPMIPVAGTPMIRRALNALPPMQQSVAVCLREHLEHTPMAQTLEEAGQGGSPVLPIVLDEVTQGQSETCRLACGHVNPDQPLLIAPCDSACDIDADRYQALLADEDIDAVIWTFRNHPNANRFPEQYGWVDLAEDGRTAKRVVCKQLPQGDVRQAPGLVGSFWFRKASTFIQAASRLKELDRRINGEFYVDSVVQLLVEQGAKVVVFDVNHFACMGTVEDVRTFEFWSDYFHRDVNHPYHACPQATASLE